MREYVKKQLLALERAIPESYDSETNSYFIPKYTKPVYLVGKSYLIELPENYQEIILNWGNNNSIPNSKFLRISVKKVIGKMISVDSVEIDPKTTLATPNMWFGWLNLDFISQVGQ